MFQKLRRRLKLRSNSKTQSRQARRRRLRTELLEDRRLLASFAVSSFLDTPDAVPGDGIVDDGAGNATLRAAIMEANATPGLDEVHLQVGTYPLTIAGRGEDSAATGDLDITDDLIITGSGRDTTLINAGGWDRVFHIFGGLDVSISGLSLTQGNASQGAGIFNAGGNLELVDSELQANLAIGESGYSGIAGANGTTPESPAEDGANGSPGGSAAGGGIYSLGGSVVVRNTLLQNYARGGRGGTGGRGGIGHAASQISDAGIGGAGGNGGFGGTAMGGDIFVIDGQLQVIGSTLSGTAVAGGGGWGGAGGFGGQGGTGSDTGGGTSRDGRAGGNGGSGGTPGEGGDALGGSLYVSSSLPIYIVDSTWDGARATGGAGGVGGMSGVGGSGGQGADGTTSTTNGGDGANGGSSGYAADGANGGDAFGGAVWLMAPAQVVSSSIANSLAIGGYGARGGNGSRGGPGGRGGNGERPSTGSFFSNGGTGGDAGNGGYGSAGGAGGLGGGAYGGATYLAGGSIELDDVIITNNNALGGAGGQGGQGSDGGHGGSGGGGDYGITSSSGSGGPGGRGGAGGDGRNGATGGRGERGGPASGGGVLVAGGILDVSTSKIELNEAEGGAGGRGGNGGRGGYGGSGGRGGNGGSSTNGQRGGSGGNGGDAGRVGSGGFAGHGGAAGDARGGGLSIDGGGLSVEDTSLESNQAIATDGGQGGNGGDGGPSRFGGTGGSGGSGNPRGYNGQDGADRPAGSARGQGNSGLNSTSTGGGIYVANLSSSAGVAVASSTISANSALQGGGISIVGDNDGDFLATNLTISGNVASSEGGGLFQQASGDGATKLVHATITGNQAPMGGGASSIGISSLRIENSLVAANTNEELFGAAIVQAGVNITTNTPGLLDPILAFNGGTTKTHAITPESAAFDAAALTIDSPITDQRGAERPGDSRNDVGAFELIVNSRPTAHDDLVVTEEDFEILIDVLADNGHGSDADPDDNLDPMLTVELTSTSNGSLFNNFDGTFFYTPDPEFSGTDSFTYQIEDAEGATAVATVSITVLPVNDVPSFLIGPAVSVAEDSGPQTFGSPGSGWATDISAGPNEESQQLTFFVTTNSNPSLFSAQPEISPDGVLTFTPAPGAHGDALFSVVLVDDGGVDNGGLDSSDEQFFEITIEAANDQPQFDELNYHFALNENSGFDSVVGHVSASDPDPSDVLTYAIVDGNTDNAFKIDDLGTIQVDNADAIDFETNPFFNLTVQVDDGSGEANGTNSVNVAINLNDLQAYLYVSDSLFPSSNGEDFGEATFQIESFGDALGFGYDVTFETVDGSATSSTAVLGGNDYNSESGVVSFSGTNEHEAYLIDVFYNNDDIVEAEEDFFLQLISVAGTNDVEIQRGTARATISDDDQATLTLMDATVVEGDNGTSVLRFPVALDAQVDADVSFDYTTTDGSASVADSDYVSVSSPVQFTLAAGGTTGQIEIVVNGDIQVEADETLTLLASHLQANGRDVTLLGTGAGGSFALLEDFQTGTLGSGLAGVSAANGQLWTADSLFVYAQDPADSSNFVATNNSSVSSDKTALLPIDATGTGTGKTVTLFYQVKAEELAGYSTGIGFYDGNGTANQLKTAWTQLVDGPGIRALGANPPQDVQAIEADDWYDVWLVMDLADDNNPQTNDRMKAFVAGPGIDGQVPLTHGNGAGDEFRFNSYDGNGMTDLVLFAHGGSQSASQFYLDNFYVDMTGANLSSPFAGVTATGTITNDDTSLLSVGDASVIEGNGETATLSFPVTLSQPVDVDVTFDYQTQDGSATTADGDYAGITTPANFTIPAGSTAGQIDIVVNGDAAVEIDETLELVVSNLQSQGRDVQLQDTVADQDNSQALSGGMAALSDRVLQQEVIVGEAGLLSEVEVFTTFAGEFVFSVYRGSAWQTGVPDFTTVVSVAEDGSQSIDVSEAGLEFEVSDQFVFQLQGVEESTPLNYRFGTGNPYPGRLFRNGSATGSLINYDLAFRTHMTQLGVASMPAVGTIINDDQATLSVSSFTQPEDGVFEFTVTTDKAVSEDITFAWGTFETPGQAVAGSDFNAASVVPAIIPAGSTSTSFTVSVIDDSVVELDEFFRVRIYNEQIGGVYSPSRLTIADPNGFATIENDDSATLSVGDASVTEGDNGTVTLSFPITLSHQVDTDVTFDYQTSDGSATTADGDYVGVTTPASFTIPAGSTSGQIDIVINSDSAVEIDETFDLLLSNLQSSGREVHFADTITDQENAPTGTIVGSDTYTYQQEVIVGEAGLLSGVEVFTSGVGQFSFALHRGTPWQSSTPEFSTVVDASEAGSQYVDLTTAGLEFAAGERFVFELQGIGNGPQGGFRSVSGNVYPGSLHRNGSTFGVANLDLAFKTQITQVGISTMPARGTIINDDQATLSVSSFTQPEDGVFEFTVTTDKAVSEDITFAWGTFETPGQAVAGSDFASASVVPATIPAGSTSATFTVNVIDDSVVELDEFFRVRIYNEQIGGVYSPSRLTIGDANGFATIENDDSATLSVGDASVIEGDNGTVTLSFPVTLSHQVDTDVTFDYQTSDGSATTADGDYVGVTTPASFTIPAGSTSAQVEIVVNGDSKVEADETLELVLSNLNAAGRDVQLSQTIFDQENLAISGGISGTSSVTWQQEVIVGENGQLAGVTLFTQGTGQFNFSVNQGTPLQSDADDYSTIVTVTENGAQFIDLSDANLNLNAGDRFVFKVNGINDGPSQGFRSTPGDSYPGRFYANGSLRTTFGIAFATHVTQVGVSEIGSTGTITNDDQANLSINSVSSSEDGDFTFTITSDKVASQDITLLANTIEVAGQAESGNDYTAISNETVTIPAGSTTATVSVSVEDDDFVEGDEIFWVRLTGEQLGGTFQPTRLRFSNSNGVGTILNDDSAPVANAGGPYSPLEGHDLTLDASQSTDADVPSQTLSYRWDVDTDGTFDFDSGASPVLAVTWSELVALGITDGPYTGTVTVEVSDGSNVNQATAALNVANQAPSLTVDTAALEINEGTSTSRGISIGDVAADTVLVTASVGSLSENGNGSWTWTYDGIDDLALTNVLITATDDDGGITTSSFDLTVKNVAPALSVDASPVAVVEGILASRPITTFDVSSDIVSVSASLGSITDNGNGNWLWSYDAADDLSTTSVTITASDEDGSQSQSTFELTVANVVPTAEISGPANGVTGQKRSFTLSATDASGVDQAAGFVFQLDWDGDGLTDETLSGPVGTKLNHEFTSAGTYTVGLIATDKDGGDSIVASTTITIVSSRMQGNNLLIGGTSADDVIEFKLGPNQGEIEAFLNGVSEGIYLVTGELRAFGDDGNDTIIVDSNITLPTRLYGDAGNDVLVGGGGPDLLVGGDGNDQLDGRGGDDVLKGNSGDDILSGGDGNDELLGGGGADELNGNAGDDILRGGGGADVLNGGSGADIIHGNGGADTLDGGSGKDLLVGGGGKDALSGGGSTDIMIGGSTSYDGDNTALKTLLAEWNSNGSYIERTSNLRDGSGSTVGANGSSYLTAGITVIDDGKQDTLDGDSGRDWFFASAADDLLSDLAANELVEAL